MQNAIAQTFRLPTKSDERPDFHISQPRRRPMGLGSLGFGFIPEMSSIEERMCKNLDFEKIPNHLETETAPLAKRGLRNFP